MTAMRRPRALVGRAPSPEPAEPSPSSWAAAGAHVYATGRSSREHGRSRSTAPSIEETGDLIRAASSGTALVVDHESPEAVSAAVDRTAATTRRLDALGNDVFGGDRYSQLGNEPMLGARPRGGLRMQRDGRRHSPRSPHTSGRR